MGDGVQRHSREAGSAHGPGRSWSPQAEGSRLGGDRPKAFAALAGRPLLAESLERLDLSDWVDAIVVAAPPDWEEPTILLAEELVASKVSAVVTGGATRAELGAKRARRGARRRARGARARRRAAARRRLGHRACCSRRLGEGVDGVVPGLPLVRHDQARRSAGCRRDDRARRASSPSRPLRRSLRSGCGRHSRASWTDATDCASLVERSGGTIGVVAGDPRLLKVTTADDLALVERLLRQAEVAVRAVFLDVGETLVDEQPLLGRDGPACRGRPAGV